MKKFLERPIHCGVLGTIKVSWLAYKFIYTPEFQRLANIKQLGVCRNVFSAAEHTRYSHSLGVYHLAKKFAKSIQVKYPGRKFPSIELGDTEMTDRIVELLSLAGLCHDIGHGPFSHVCDDKIFRHFDHPLAKHEVRSCKIFERIVQRELPDEFSENEVRFIQAVIHPEEEHKSKGVLYQIVANPLNGIDVDKWDYLSRDSKFVGIDVSFNYNRLLEEYLIDQNNDIAYPYQSRDDVYQLFYSRFRMHSIVYSHHTVKVIEEMLGDIIANINKALKVFDVNNFDLEVFLSLDDSSFSHWIEDYRLNIAGFRDRLSPEADEYMKLALCIYNKLSKRDYYEEVSENTPGSRKSEHILISDLEETFKHIKFYDRGSTDTYHLTVEEVNPLSHSNVNISKTVWILPYKL